MSHYFTDAPSVQANICHKQVLCRTASQRKRLTDRQTDRQMDGWTDGQTDRQMAEDGTDTSSQFSHRTKLIVVYVSKEIWNRIRLTKM